MTLPLLQHTTLLRLFCYEPETGHFIRRIRRGNRALAGSRAGGVRGNGYRYISIDGYSYLEHRLAWFYMTKSWPARALDHEVRVIVEPEVVVREVLQWAST